MKKFFENLLDIILPRSKEVRELEAMTVTELQARASHSQNGDDSKVLTIFDYKHPLIRRAIWELKYRGNKKIARLLADCLFEELAVDLSERHSLSFFEKPILVPIPISKKRRRERGWNQTELLTNALIDRGDTDAFFEINNNILEKIKDTDSQTKKNRKERLENLSGCFRVIKPEKIRGRNIILLDDVITTGATFEEARRTLKASGAKKVIAVAIAH